MRAMRGTSFDPVVLGAFFTIEDSIKEITVKYRDEREDALQGEEGALITGSEFLQTKTRTASFSP